MPTVGAIIIGEEILTGKFADENTPWLARRLRELGLDLRRVSVVPDEIGLIGEDVARFSRLFDHVFTTGGIGPTHDDVTFYGIAAAFGVPVYRHPKLEGLLRTRMGAACTDAALRMAEIPDGAELWWEGPISWPLVVMRNVCIFPGVPSLFRRKFEAVVHRFHGIPVMGRRLMTSAQETAIARILGDAAARWPSVAIGSYPQLDVKPWTVTVTMDSRDLEALDACEGYLREALADGLMAPSQER